MYVYVRVSPTTAQKYPMVDPEHVELGTDKERVDGVQPAFEIKSCADIYTRTSWVDSDVCNARKYHSLFEHVDLCGKKRTSKQSFQYQLRETTAHILNICFSSVGLR